MGCQPTVWRVWPCHTDLDKLANSPLRPSLPSSHHHHLHRGRHLLSSPPIFTPLSRFFRMQIINAAAASAIILSGFAAAQDSFSVATPSSLVQCQPYLITWTGGSAPFFPRITQPGNTASIIENFPQTSDRTYSWTVDQPVGQRVTIVIGDSTGATAPSGQSPSVAAGSSSSW